MKYKTMQYWHKLEHFYPYILESQHNENIKTFMIHGKEDFPKFDCPDIPKNMQVRYYEVYLGIFKADSALNVIAKRLRAEKEFQDESDERSCFCKFRLDPRGHFDKGSFKVSSFPWAVQRVTQEKIYLEKWDDDFHKFQELFFMKLFAAPDAITYEMMEDIIKYVSASIGWEIVFDEFWLRMDRVIGEYRQPAKTDVLEKDEEDYDINTVVDELVKANDLADQDALCEKLRAKEKEQRKKVRQWIFNNVGTIHTFQGKEADMVILCLGVDSSDRGNGAIGWASEKPNILNVAVTRAKNRLYIVGDEKRWSGRPFFKTAYEICTKRSPAL